MPGKQRTGTRTAANKAARLPARPGRHESPANTPQTPRTGGAGRTPDNGEEADAQRATARSGIPKKFIYTMRSKRNLKPPRRFEGIRPRTGTGGELGSAAANPTANRRRKSGRFFRRPRPRDSARTPGRLVEGRGMVAAHKCAFECSVSRVLHKVRTRESHAHESGIYGGAA